MSMPFRAGQLRHTIQIQAQTITPDGGGGGPPTWATIANGTVKASIVPDRSDEVYLDNQQQEIGFFTIVTRYISGVNTGQRAYFVDSRTGARYFDIKSVNDVQERHRWLVLRALERKAGQP